jgi:phosphatidylglycerophosphate synthase
MSKLQKDDKFLDLSDYGRPVAKWIVAILKNTTITPVQVTLLFGISGCIAICCILVKYYIAAGVFLILKSILDAADGELSRVKNTPSYFGRYLDSIFDIILNAFILIAIMVVTNTSIGLTIVAFTCIQLQGTLYNYYYVILRNKVAGGDVTSKIFENETPMAFPGESQMAVNISFQIFTVLYKFFDKTIFYLDKNAVESNIMPNWFMSIISTYGLGFQLLIIAVMLPLGYIHMVIPFFIIYSILLIVFISIRKYVL